MHRLCMATLTGAALAIPVLLVSGVLSRAKANDMIEYPLDTPCYPFQRSYLTGQAVVIPPYRRVFPVRVYTTPQQQPYYNVPPYSVISPY